jgi:phospholipase/carboxylesterase
VLLAADNPGRAAGLRYLEVVQGASSRDEKLPMIVFIHGRGDSAHPGWIEGFPLRARFIFPEAPDPFEGGGFSWFHYSVRDTDDATLARDMGERADQLARMLDELQRRRPTQGKPIVAGFSQGGMLSYALALRHPEAVAFVLPIAGMLPDPLFAEVPRAGVRYPPVRALHGRDDDVVAFARTQHMVDTLKARGLDIALDSYPGVRHFISDPMRTRMHELIAAAATATH